MMESEVVLMMDNWNLHHRISHGNQKVELRQIPMMASQVGILLVNLRDHH